MGLDVTGLAEGDALGATVGFELGDDVGLVLGLPVTGFAVGDEVGTLVGWKQQVICIKFEFLSYSQNLPDSRLTLFDGGLVGLFVGGFVGFKVG